MGQRASREQRLKPLTEPELRLSDFSPGLSQEEKLELARTLHYLACEPGSCLIDYEGIPCCVICTCSHTNGEHGYDQVCHSWLTGDTKCDCKRFTPA